MWSVEITYTFHGETHRWYFISNKATNVLAAWDACAAFGNRHVEPFDIVQVEVSES